VASRAILILVAALLAFHLLGYWVYHIGVESQATAAATRSLAERIVSIKRAIASIPMEPERDRVAHDLSSASLEVHWSKVSLVLGNAPATERTRARSWKRGSRSSRPISPPDHSASASRMTAHWEGQGRCLPAHDAGLGQARPMAPG
jgi:hypothetical protein